MAYETVIVPWRANTSGASSDATGAACCIPGLNYAFEMAANLAGPNRTALATHSPIQGTFTFSDTDATNRSRFNRAVKQQGGQRNTMSKVPKQNINNNSKQSMNL